VIRLWLILSRLAQSASLADSGQSLCETEFLQRGRGDIPASCSGVAGPGASVVAVQHDGVFGCPEGTGKTA